MVFFDSRHQRAAILLGLLTVGLAIALAQGGSIRGRVVADIPDQRRVLPGVVVTLSGDRLGDRKTQSVTDSAGQFDFQSLIAGDYVVIVEFSGFKKYEQRLSVQIDATVEHDILLQPVPLTETVTITDDRTDASSTDSTTPSVLTQQTLRDAPLIDQKFQDALPLLPGVVRGPDGNLNIKGTRPSQSGILVSSLNVTDPVTGTPAIELPLEAVDTVQVYSNPYSSEFGKFTGAVTAIETRSGSNELRYVMTGVLPRPRWRDGKLFGIGAATPRIAVGGPIRKDKDFVFLSFEGWQERTPFPTVNNTVPAEMRTGDGFTLYGQRIYDPMTSRTCVSGVDAPTCLAGGLYIRTQFPGNVIPASRIDPVAKRIVDAVCFSSVSGARQPPSASGHQPTTT